MHFVKEKTCLLSQNFIPPLSSFVFPNYKSHIVNIVSGEGHAHVHGHGHGIMVSKESCTQLLRYRVIIVVSFFKLFFPSLI